MVKKMRLLAILLLLLSQGVCGANFEVTVAGVTATQAVLTYRAPDEHPCIVYVWETGASTVAYDTDAALFPGADLDTKPGNAVIGDQRTVVLGKRAVEKAADGKLYSRALQANTPHEYAVTCAGQTAVGQFVTNNPPIGNTYPELPGYNKDGFGNYAWPSIDWADRDKTYVDPLTGIALKRATAPGDMGALQRDQRFVAAYDASGTWTNAADAISGSLSTRASTSGTDPLFLSINALNIDYTNPAGFEVYSLGVDDILEKAYGMGTDSAEENRRFEVCLTLDSGQSCASDALTLVAPTGSAAEIPSPGGFPAPGFRRWNMKNLDRSLVAPASGKVDVAGNLVVLKSDGARAFFNLNWTRGTKLYIQNSAPACVQSLCTIDEVLHSGNLKIQEAVTLVGVDYRAANFGLRVRKVTSTGTLSVSFAFDLAASRMFGVPSNGSSDFCSRNTATTTVAANGAPLTTPLTGSLCILPTTTGGSALYFLIPSTGEIRFISSFSRQMSGSQKDELGAGNFNVRPSSFDPTDPRAFYAVADTGGNPYYRTLWRGRYTGDFRSLQSNYSNVTNDGVQWTNLTPASQSRDIGTQLRAAHPAYDPAIQGYLIAVGVLEDYYVLWAGSAQDAPCIVTIIDLKTGNLQRAKDSWSEYPGRWGVCHTIQPYGGGGWILSGINAARYPMSYAGLGGPYYLRITQVFKGGMWTNDTSLNENYGDECPADISQQWKNMGAVGAKCVKIRVGGEPCSETPTAAEKSKYPCPYDSNKSMLQTMAEGDLITDFSQGSLYERLRIVKKVVNSSTDIELTLHRRAICGSLDLPPSFYRHADGWRASMTQEGGCHGAGWWLNMAGTPPGWVGEDPLLTSSHNDIGAAPSAGSLSTVVGSYSVRYDQPMTAQMGRPLTIQINGWPTFAGSGAVIQGNGLIETYPSMRHWNAPAGEKRWTIDMRAYQSGLGVGSESPLPLFNTTLQRVGGTNQVYKINNPKAGFDRKRLPYVAWAGRYWLRDISGPSSRIGDTDFYSYCVADRAGECVDGSSVNDVYVNVPKATVASPQPFCATNHLGGNYPCFTTASPVGAWVVQWDISRSDQVGQYFRRLTMGLSGPGRQYTFANARPSPDGKWVFLPAYWLEGYRMDLLLAKLPPWPAEDTVGRTDFVPVEVSLSSVTDAPKARIRFGYAENGDPGEFLCTSRRESCVVGGNPYSFQGEAAGILDCPDGCVQRIPAIPGRVLYYQVERLDNGGNAVVTEPLNAVAVP